MSPPYFSCHLKSAKENSKNEEAILEKLFLEGKVEEVFEKVAEEKLLAIVCDFPTNCLYNMDVNR